MRQKSPDIFAKPPCKKLSRTSYFLCILRTNSICKTVLPSKKWNPDARWNHQIMEKRRLHFSNWRTLKICMQIAWNLFRWFILQKTFTQLQSDQKIFLLLSISPDDRQPCQFDKSSFVRLQRAFTTFSTSWGLVSKSIPNN